MVKFAIQFGERFSGSSEDKDSRHPGTGSRAKSATSILPHHSNRALNPSF